MEMGEAIATGGLIEEMEEKCPFNEDIKGVSSKEKENIEDDDLEDVQEAQDNDGGVLGKNLNEGSNGEPGTWKGAPNEPTKAEKKFANDSLRRQGKKLAKNWQKVRVKGTQNIGVGLFPFTVAAHHLIPGNAALYTDDNDLQNYMIEGKSISAGGKSWKIKYHIGYNVNGAHNGVWLPGNYAIRSKTSPTGVTWGDMGNEDWQMHYVAACAKAVGGQFHDGHVKYSESVKKLLNKIAEKLEFHQERCDICKKKTNQISPPYMIKNRLYALSKYFKQNLTSEPSQWRRPWFASDRWRDAVFKNNADGPCEEFWDAYNQATLEEFGEK